MDEKNFTSAVDEPKLQERLDEFFKKKSAIIFSSFTELNPCSDIMIYRISFRRRNPNCQCRKKYIENRNKITQACKELKNFCKKNDIYIKVDIDFTDNGSLYVKVECECYKFLELFKE